MQALVHRLTQSDVQRVFVGILENLRLFVRTLQTNTPVNDVDWRILRQLVPYLFEFRARIVLALLCLIGAKIASVGLPFILKHLVDDLEQGTDTGVMIALPLGLLLAYGSVRFANVLFGELRDTLFGRVTERAMRRIGLKVFEHLHALDLEFHLNRRTGGLSRDIERGTNGISFLLRFMVFNIVPTFIEIGLVIVLLWINYSIWYALIIFLAVSSYVGFSVFATEWRTRFVREANEAESRTSTRAVDSLLNFETVKYFGNEAYEAEHYDTELASWEQARRRNRLSLFVLNGGQAFIIAASMTAAMVLAATNVMDQTMTIGDFVLINAFMMQIFMPLNFLGFVYREMKGAMANIEAMFGLLKQSPAVVDCPGARPLRLTEGEIRFENVHFHYQSNRPILHNLSFTVPARRKLAIVGSSGAGKSTLFKLLFRFYDPCKGNISIDGQDIRQVTQRSLRSAIAVIPQDTVLFNMTIGENIRYGRVDATEKEVWAAVEAAHLSAFIESLPEGLDTKVGERGLKLSGGEKQRVAIARAILKKTPIIVFDEATSSLDSRAERSILEAMQRIAKNHTSLVIAHRLSTIVGADEIIVLDKGRLVERGTHTELLMHGGHYAALWALQRKEN